jgi:hypothetical protein
VERDGDYGHYDDHRCEDQDDVAVAPFATASSGPFTLGVAHNCSCAFQLFRAVGCDPVVLAWVTQPSMQFAQQVRDPLGRRFGHLRLRGQFAGDSRLDFLNKQAFAR